LENRPAPVSIRRRIIAFIATVLLVVIVWKVIDYRTQPPPPPMALVQPSER